MPAVIRKLDPRTTIFSVNFNRFGVVAFGGRSTAVALASGNIVAFASHPLDDESKTALSQLGNGKVSHIVALDAEHAMYMSQYAQQYPSARLVGPAGLVKKRTDLTFSTSLPDQPLDSELAAEFQAIALPGHPNEDVVWYHAPTKTVIEADVIFNCPDKDQVTGSYWPPAVLANQFAVGSKVHSALGYGFSRAKPTEFGAAIKQILSLDFNRIIPCHGSVIEGDAAKQAFRTVYGSLLK